MPDDIKGEAMQLRSDILSRFLIGAVLSLPQIAGATCNGADCDPRNVTHPAKEAVFKVINMTVPEALTMLQTQMGGRMSISPQVRGRIEGITLSGSMEDMIDEIARREDLDWFAYEDVHYVSRAQDIKTRIVALDVPSDLAMRTLAESGLPIDARRVRSIANDSALSVSASAEYVALIEAILHFTEAPIFEIIPPEPVIKVRRGRETTLERYGTATPDQEGAGDAPEESAEDGSDDSGPSIEKSPEEG